MEAGYLSGLWEAGNRPYRVYGRLVIIGFDTRDEIIKVFMDLCRQHMFCVLLVHMFNLQMSDTLYTVGGSCKAFKAIITASIVGYPLNVKEVQINKDGSVPEGASPTGLFPYLETPNGCISESNAICRYIAR